MRFLHYATEDCRGGAAKAAYYIHHLLLSRGHSSQMVVRDKSSYDDPTVHVVPISPLKYRLDRIRRRLPGLHPPVFKAKAAFNFDTEGLLSDEAFFPISPADVDLVLVHWITGFLTIRQIRLIYDHYRCPVVMVMNDQQPITGGCHYSLGCDGYTRKCGNCPLLDAPSDHDRSRVVWERKHTLLSPLPLVIWSGSSGSTAKLARSSLFSGHRRLTLLGSIDDTAFRPLKREWARDILRLPQDKHIIFLAATMIDDERKGMKYAIEALKFLHLMSGERGAIHSEDVHLAIAGHGAEACRAKLSFPLTKLGYLNDSISLALAYQAADVFLCPTVDDEGPMMVTESMMCGTPVVMFKVGIAGDLIRDGETGYAVPVGDAAALARALNLVLTSPDTTSMCDAAHISASYAQSPLHAVPRMEDAMRSIIMDGETRSRQR
jgi:glycosyltransferase involved in cell wall biosynthesis